MPASATADRSSPTLRIVNINKLKQSLLRASPLVVVPTVFFLAMDLDDGLFDVFGDEGGGGAAARAREEEGADEAPAVR